MSEAELKKKLHEMMDFDGVLDLFLAMQKAEFRRGAEAAAAIAADYNATSSHPYRLDDCILSKLNLSNQVRPNDQRKPESKR
jgi:hypothetical protein